MNTVSLVTYIKRALQNWTRTEILSLVNEVQTMMMCKEVHQCRALSATTGVDYLFTTTDGTYSYNISTANGFPFDGWKVVAVKSNVDDEQLDWINCTMTESTYDSTASILFDDDPGSSEYYIHYYKKPTPILAETTNSVVPERFHMSTLLEGVLGMAERIDHGVSDRFEKFERELLPIFWAEMNKSKPTGDYINTPLRGF